MSTFTSGGAYKVTPNDVELFKTLAPWPGYEYNTLCYQLVRQFLQIPVFIGYIPLLLIRC
jgi:hypothetical protein